MAATVEGPCASPFLEPGLHPADDRRVYDEYVAMLAEDERKQETETPWPPSMESLGLDPASEFDCEAYAGYLEAVADAVIEREIAEDEAAIDAQDIADQVVLRALDEATQEADPSEAERIITEARQVADEFASRYWPSRWTMRPEPPRARTPIIRAGAHVVRARAREPRRPNLRHTSRRARAPGRRSSPGRPGDDDPEPEPVSPRRREAV